MQILLNFPFYKNIIILARNYLLNRMDAYESMVFYIHLYLILQGKKISKNNLKDIIVTTSEIEELSG